MLNRLAKVVRPEEEAAVRRIDTIQPPALSEACMPDYVVALLVSHAITTWDDLYTTFTGETPLLCPKREQTAKAKGTVRLHWPLSGLAGRSSWPREIEIWEMIYHRLRVSRGRLARQIV